MCLRSEASHHHRPRLFTDEGGAWDLFYPGVCLPHGRRKEKTHCLQRSPVHHLRRGHSKIQLYLFLSTSLPWFDLPSPLFSFSLSPSLSLFSLLLSLYLSTRSLSLCISILIRCLNSHSEEWRHRTEADALHREAFQVHRQILMRTTLSD